MCVLPILTLQLEQLFNIHEILIDYIYLVVINKINIVVLLFFYIIIYILLYYIYYIIILKHININLI